MTGFGQWGNGFNSLPMELKDLKELVNWAKMFVGREGFGLLDRLVQGM